MRCVCGRGCNLKIEGKRLSDACEREGATVIVMVRESEMYVRERVRQ